MDLSKQPQGTHGDLGHAPPAPNTPLPYASVEQKKHMGFMQEQHMHFTLWRSNSQDLVGNIESS